MKKRKINLFLIILLISMLQGCASTDPDTNTEGTMKNQNAQNTSLYYPEYQNVLLTDLQNCDITYMDNMMAHDFTASLYSLEKLNVDELKISFDTDIAYDIQIMEDDPITRDSFGYTLFCAYNNRSIVKYGEEITEITYEDYLRDIVNNEAIPSFYSYSVYVYLKIEEPGVEYLDDLEINKMSIIYNDQSYDFDIGSIKYDPTSEFHEKFAKWLDGENSAYVKNAAQNYIALDNFSEGYFKIDLEESLVTFDEEMVLTSINLSNVDGIQLVETTVTMQNNDYTMNVKYNEGDTIVIPQNTIVSIELLGQLDSLKNEIGSYYSISVDVDYSIGEKNDNFQYQVLAKNYLRTPYEIYAYQVDAINIFDYYLNKISYYDEYE